MIKKIISIILFLICYVPALLATIFYDGIKESNFFFYNSHQTLKFLLDK